MSAPVLLLNASYEPMLAISYQRAISLIIEKRAELVSAIEGKVIRSPSTSFPWPSVVRLLHYVKVPFRRNKIPLTKKNILARDNYECCFCTKRKADSVDHLIPKSKGGEHSWMNLVAACRKCNSAKDDRTPVQAGMKMRFQPYVPTPERWMAMGLVKQPDWDSWLPVT